MPTVMITGSNRGIGLEFVRQYAAEGWRVVAACRAPRSARELATIGGDVKIHALDVADDYQVAALARTLVDEPIDILINNAGINVEEDSFGKTPANDWLEVLRINTVAPLHVAEQFIGHLEKGQRRLIVNISSRMGSIADNSGGGSYIYRSSKAALNMVSKSMAQDLKPRRMTVVVFHPGWVKTDMGGPNATVTPKASVTGMRAKIAQVTPADTGRFYNFDGQPIPW